MIGHKHVKSLSQKVTHSYPRSFWLEMCCQFSVMKNLNLKKFELQSSKFEADAVIVIPAYTIKDRSQTEVKFTDEVQ
jgi:hypothetical protein